MSSYSADDCDFFFVIFFKTHFVSFIIFQAKALNIITIQTTHCIYINKGYENFSLVLHAQDTEDSRQFLSYAATTATYTAP